MSLCWPFIYFCSCYEYLWLGFGETNEKTTTQAIFTNLMDMVRCNLCISFNSSKSDIYQFKFSLKTFIENYKAHFEKWLFTLFSNLLDHLEEHKTKFGSSKYLDAIAFEKINFSLRRSFRSFFLMKSTIME